MFIFTKDNDYIIKENQDDGWFYCYYKEENFAKAKTIDQARKAIYLDRKKRFDIQEFVGPEHFVER